MEEFIPNGRYGIPWRKAGADPLILRCNSAVEP